MLLTHAKSTFASCPLKAPSVLSTNCSPQPSPKKENAPPASTSRNKGRKRIGRYSFRLEHTIGSGFSSRVYKGIRDDKPDEWFAIKAIGVKEMGVAKTYLLGTEIQVMAGLEHPHVVKLIEVLHTSNHCYIITQYCQGGTLQRYVQGKHGVQWGSIVYQLAQGCQFLASRNIVHRDLKPANIFLKEGKWKIGDFGFAKRIPSSTALIMEGFRVGSPLFMPLQTLERNMYSAKSDSFALGVMVYFLICGEYPWEGSSLNKLVKNYKEKAIDWSKFELLAPQVTDTVRGLLSVQMKSRLMLVDCDFSAFLGEKSVAEMEKGLIGGLGGKVRQQVVLCQFVNYLARNSIFFLEDGHRLYSLMSDHLHHLTRAFKWNDNKCLAQMKKEYILPQGKVRINEDTYRRLLVSLKEVIYRMKEKEEAVQQVALEKLLEYYCICKLTYRAQGDKLSQFLKGIVLHKEFKGLMASVGKIQKLMAMLVNQ